MVSNGKQLQVEQVDVEARRAGIPQPKPNVAAHTTNHSTMRPPCTLPLLLAALLAAAVACAAAARPPTVADALGGRRLRATGDLVIDAKLTTDPSGGVAPPAERLRAWEALAGPRIEAVEAEARCRAAKRRAASARAAAAAGSDAGGGAGGALGVWLVGDHKAKAVGGGGSEGQQAVGVGGGGGKRRRQRVPRECIEAQALLAFPEDSIYDDYDAPQPEVVPCYVSSPLAAALGVLLRGARWRGGLCEAACKP